jgi:hypothetical protein
LNAATVGAIAGIGIVFGLAVGAGAVYAATHDDDAPTSASEAVATAGQSDQVPTQGGPGGDRQQGTGNRPDESLGGTTGGGDAYPSEEGGYSTDDLDDGFDASAVPVEPGQNQMPGPGRESGGAPHSRSGAS